MTNYKMYSNEGLAAAVEEEIAYQATMLSVDLQDKLDDIEILQHEEEQLLREWWYRIKEHYHIITAIRCEIAMQYLYHDWYEATMHWYLYNDTVGKMIQLYLNEIENDLMDCWETSQVAR